VSPIVRSRLARSPTAPRGQRARQRLNAARFHVGALLREFRIPIGGFVAVAVVGGLVYGELYRWARGVSIPLIDRPYVMVQLMLVEAPESVPPEWYLALFWYALPLTFIVLVGLGAADFLDLFFNREENRDRWGEALAMTYRHHAIVLGAGHLGLRVVRDLKDMGIPVVVIDLEPKDEAGEVLERLHVPVVYGDGRRGRTLEHAGLANAEVFVACTGDDLMNLECVMKVRELSPRVRVVARVWDRGVGDQMKRFGMVDTVMSAADLSAPAFAGAALGIEITQTLEVAGEEYSTIRLTVGERSFMVGEEVGALERADEMEIVLVCRSGSVTVDPSPDERVRAGDDVVIFARHDRILEIVARNRRGRAA
jgi:Trk K+ transport system NAD-binding subunit